MCEVHPALEQPRRDLVKTKLDEKEAHTETEENVGEGQLLFEGFPNTESKTCKSNDEEKFSLFADFNRVQICLPF